MGATHDVEVLDQLALLRRLATVHDMIKTHQTAFKESRIMMALLDLGANIDRGHSFVSKLAKKIFQRSFDFLVDLWDLDVGAVSLIGSL